MTDQHPLTLYNSLTRTKEQFIPQDPKRVTMYNCGPTVYSYAHIGNARAAVVADVLFRVLRHIYGEDHVVYARNITDVDDKIIAAATEQGVDISEITEKYARIYNEDLAALNCLPPTHQPKATEAMDEMQDIIVELLEKDIAYISGNQVLFDVTKDEGYGRLVSKKLLDGAAAGMRVAVADYKRNAGDFLLWKHVAGEDAQYSYEVSKIQAFADSDENWRKYANAPSQLSPGRPGWHIECSAMIRQVLGETIDIHCGGIDLKFPHHENEIAQSSCANGKKLSNYWVHNEFLNMGSEKMSKSLGNVTLVHDLLEKWDGEVIRLALLKAHYRSELNWSEDLLRESQEQLDKWYKIKRKWTDRNLEVAPYTMSMERGVLNDLGIPFVFGFISQAVPALRIGVKPFVSYAEAGVAKVIPKMTTDERRDAVGKFLVSLNLLGLLQRDPEEWFSGGISEVDKALAKDYDVARGRALEAKKAGDKAAMGAAFKASDAIRDQLAAKGLVLETSADGQSTLRKA